MSRKKTICLENALIILGHRSVAITEVYAELDQQKALEAIVKVGLKKETADVPPLGDFN